MAYNDGYISAPVGFYDVQRCLGSSSGDDGTLCTRSNINMWAKYKPIKYNKIGVMTDTDFATNVEQSSSTYVCTWGIKRSNSYNYSDFEENGVIKSQVWTYNRPTGGSTSPYRITDFNGYYHRAVAPIEIHLPTEDVIAIPSESGADGSTLMFAFEFGNAVYGWYSDKCISLSTFLTATELGYYPTIQMVCSSGSTYRYAVSADKTVQGFLNSGNPMGYVLVDTKKMKSVFGGAACMNANKVWTACLILTPSRYTGESGSYEISSGRIGRLEYASGVDRKQFTVKNTVIVDKITRLSFTVTIVKNNSTNRYYVSSIVATATKSTNDAVPLNIKITYTCVNGSIIGGSPTGNKLVINDSFNLPQGTTSSYSKTFSGSAITTPEFYWTSDQVSQMNGQRPVAISIEFIPGTGYGALSGNVAIDCSSSTLTATKTIK